MKNSSVLSQGNLFYDPHFFRISHFTSLSGKTTLSLGAVVNNSEGKVKQISDVVRTLKDFTEMISHRLLNIHSRPANPTHLEDARRPSSS